MTNDKHSREVKAAGAVYEELEAALEASYGSYMEPSNLIGRTHAGTTLEVKLRDGSRYRLDVTEIQSPTE